MVTIRHEQNSANKNHRFPQGGHVGFIILAEASIADLCCHPVSSSTLPRNFSC